MAVPNCMICTSIKSWERVLPGTGLKKIKQNLGDLIEILTFFFCCECGSALSFASRQVDSTLNSTCRLPINDSAGLMGGGFISALGIELDRDLR